MFAFVKDKFVEEKNATISINERGFRFGDGVFETIRVTNSKIYQFDSHKKRLNIGCESLKINFDSAELKSVCYSLLNKNNIKDGILRISVSRGVGSIGYLPKVEDGVTLIIQTLPLPIKIHDSVDLWFCSQYFAFNNNLHAGIKTMQGLNYSLAKILASENNCYDSLMVDSNKNICETSSANIFWVKDNVLFTPQINSGSVEGTIRNKIIELSPYKVIIDNFYIDEIKEAEEVFITNIAQLILSISNIKSLNNSYNKTKVADEMLEIILLDIKNAVS